MKILAVDGNSLVNRAFYGVKPLTTHDGRNTNAVFGFINMLNREIIELKPDFAAVAFDLKAPTFRHKAQDYYKANRTGMPQELAEQFDDAKRAAQYLGLHVITCEGFEADDILGTISSFASKDIQVYLLTGDRDSYQLINDNVFVRYVSTKETVLTDSKLIHEKYGLTPKALIQVKALMGDTSDNIPGVKGIGEKTAIDLVKRFGTVEKLYSELDQTELLTKSVKARLTDGKQKAFESLFLAEIRLDAPIGVSLDDIKYTGMDKKKLCELCESLELNSIIERLDLRDKNSQSDGERQTQIHLECKDMELFDKEKLCDVAAYFDFENALLYVSPSEDGQNTAYRLPMTKQNLALLFSDGVSVSLHDLKAKLLYLYSIGITETKARVYDVLLASYVADPANTVGEDRLPFIYGGYGITENDSPEKKALLALNSIKRLKKELSEKIHDAGQENLLENIEIPLSYVLADMENTGFLVDKSELENFGKELEKAEHERAQKIYSLAGEEFNINSPKQLSYILFEKLQLPTGKKTKNGYSTDADTLEKLREYSPIIDEITEYRLVTKLKSTYADGLLKAIAPDGRLHTNFKQALTLTGRLSSADPNLQNIPIRTPEGRRFRKVFIAEKGKTLIDADYSQIELRLMAAMSGDKNMIEAFCSGEDIHTMTASQVFGVEIDEVTPEMRKKAKAVNFGIIYGISDFSLAGDIKVTKKEAASYIARYFEKYPGIKSYLDEVKQKAYQNGYVTTLYGRRRYIPELKSKTYVQKMFGERVAMNAPIQGTAADIIKIAMINVYNELKAQNLDAKLILQVHDELIIECSESDAQRVKDLLKEKMECAASLDVALSVSIAKGHDWEACHE